MQGHEHATETLGRYTDVVAKKSAIEHEIAWCPQCRAAFDRQVGFTVNAWPSDAAREEARARGQAERQRLIGLVKRRREAAEKRGV